MGEKPIARVEIRDFSGMVSGIDAHDLRPGQAVLQLNVKTIRKGELVTRRGLKELTFDPED